MFRTKNIKNKDCTNKINLKETTRGLRKSKIDMEKQI